MSIRRSRITDLTVVSALLALAFVVVPRWLIALLSSAPTDDPDALAVDVARAFSGWVAGGRAELTPELDSLVGAWQAFHVVKAAIAVVLCGVLVALARNLREARPDDLAGTVASRSDRGRRTRGALAGAAMLAAVGAAALLEANLQGAVAPLGSTISLADLGPGTATAAATDALRADLAAHAASGTALAPKTAALLDDFRCYHAVFVMLGGVGLALLVRCGALAVQRTGRRRSVLPWLGGALLTLAVLAANLATTLGPVPALRGFLAGGS